MSNVLVLGAGWVGAPGAAPAPGHTRGGAGELIHPPVGTARCRKDAAATAHLRAVIERAGITSVVNACGRVQGSDDELTDANLRFV